MEISIGELRSRVGEEMGVSDWFTVTQEDVNAFAKVTRDEQWIHVDVERARRESPFGGPIAHGYFTLSLVSYLLSTIWTVSDASAALNYGLNRLRFPAPVLIGSRLRLRVMLNSVEDVTGGVQVNVTLTVELEGVSKPACVAEGLFRYYA